MAGGSLGHSAAYRAAVARRGPAIDAARERLAAAAPAAPTMPPVTFILAGTPVAWARTRVAASGRHFNPAKQRTNAGILRMAASAAMGDRPLFQCAVRLDVIAEFPVPVSWSKKRQALALAGGIQPVARPDLSNVVKQVEDAIIGVCVRDDSAIVVLQAQKRYSPTPRLVVTITDVERPAMSRATGLFSAAELPLGFAR
jgi:Holliday junction resolvase RusA-like endonuclease